MLDLKNLLLKAFSLTYFHVLNTLAIGRKGSCAGFKGEEKEIKL